ncbi:MAG: NACHT domain-containing protein, partial [bacterium]
MEKPRPEESALFEEQVKDCLAEPGMPFYLYGRRGQNQHGIDIHSDQFKTVVQCKAFDQDPKSYPALLKQIQKDYPRACKHFPQMERFLVATTLKRDTNTQDKLQALAVPGKPIGTLFREDIDSLLATKRMNTANKDYADDFAAPLFLHQDNPAVCLRNLFVLQDYTPKAEDGKDLWGRIADFVADGWKEFFLIEGDAGCGKTSLVNALAWHAQEEDETARLVLGDRPLVVVRLRDLDTEKITRQKGLLPALLAYLNIPDKETLLARFPKAVLVLDGFDELCLMEGYAEGEELLNRLWRERLEGCKVIVTSRPNYIRENLAIP